VYELADQVFCVSEQLKQLYSGRLGFPARRIKVIHNGVDTSRFTPDPAARNRLRAELEISEAELCIGCVANLTPVKDHMTLLRAMAELARASRSWRLLLAGEGPERTALENFVAGHPEWSGRVRFLGLDTRVPELLNAFDVFVLTSVTEGISNSVLEAMASGLPVVVTETGGNPELVADGESGLLFPVADHRRLAAHLLALERDMDLRLQLARKALERVRKEFSLSAMIRNYDWLYTQLASGDNFIQGQRY
jgi:glycosyltransferase involved in cell wall biosynthesis